ERGWEIDDICQMIRNAARVGTPALKYNMSILGVVRTASTRGRGGASYSAFVGDGDVDMLKAIQVYKEVGYNGMLMPDHDHGRRERLSGVCLHVRIHPSPYRGRRGGIVIVDVVRAEGVRGYRPIASRRIGLAADDELDRSPVRSSGLFWMNDWAEQWR